MLIRKILPGLVVLAMLAATSCAGVAAALLVNQLLDDQAPERTWTGTVTDTNGLPVGGLLVQVKAEVLGDDNVLHYSGTTDYAGAYNITFRWHEDINYTLKVVYDGEVFAEEVIGKITLTDQVNDFTVPAR